jgi:hypothetical protein
MFLSEICPLITYTLINKFIESVKKPTLPEYENITERIQSYPLAWREEDLETIENMSDAGFFYPGFGDTGRCFHCACILTNIRTQTMPLFRHASRFPTCRYVKHKLTEDEIKHATVKFKDEGE